MINIHKTRAIYTEQHDSGSKQLASAAGTSRSCVISTNVTINFFEVNRSRDYSASTPSRLAKSFPFEVFTSFQAYFYEEGT
jgi:hypothetical protein